MAKKKAYIDIFVFWPDVEACEGVAFFDNETGDRIAEALTWYSGEDFEKKTYEDWANELFNDMVTDGDIDGNEYELVFDKE